MQESKKSVTGFGVKLVALVTMAIDHVGAAIIEPIINRGQNLASETGGADALANYVTTHQYLYVADDILRLTGRLAFPLFCFLLCEGFMKTKHLKKYMLNLLIFGIVAEVPFNLAFNFGQVLCFDHQNVFFTLLIGLLTLTGIRFFSNREYKRSFMILDTACGAIFAGVVAVVFIYESFIYSAIVSGVDFGLKFLLVVGLIGAVIYIFATIGLTSRERSARCMCFFVTAVGLFVADALKTDYAAGGVLAIVMIYLGMTRIKKVAGESVESSKNSAEDTFHATERAEEISEGSFNATEKAAEVASKAAASKDVPSRAAGLGYNPVKALNWGIITLVVMNPVEFTAFLDLLLIKRYGGERGRSMKYFFYIFYPAHLLIYYFVARALGAY